MGFLLARRCVLLSSLLKRDSEQEPIFWLKIFREDVKAKQRLKFQFKARLLILNTTNMVINNESESLNCPQSGKKFSSKSNLTRHIGVHAIDKPFNCSNCQHKCSTASDLKRHEKIHTCDKPFSCSQCIYKCSDSSKLKRHERIHTGVKPYSCSECDKSFG